MQNTPKLGIFGTIFSEKLGNSPYLCTNTHKVNILVGKTLKNLDFPHNNEQIYKINPVQITTITAENTENSLNSVPHTIEKYPIQNCEKFSPIVKVNLALFSSVIAIIVPLLLIALMLSVKGSNQLLINLL